MKILGFIKTVILSPYLLPFIEGIEHFLGLLIAYYFMPKSTLRLEKDERSLVQLSMQDAL